MLNILLALSAGFLTIGAPCILPLLPIILGSSIGQKSKLRPIYIIIGFVVAFTAASLVLSALISRFNFSPTTLRQIAIILLGIFGLLMIWPKPFELLSRRFVKLIGKANEIGTRRSDNLGGFILGLTLGIIWTPCAGPVLGTILTLIATQTNLAQAAILLIAYALGAGIPMLLIAYGSRYLTTRIKSFTRYSVRLQRIFGIIIILVAIAMFKNYDIALENSLTGLFSRATGGGSAVMLSNYGPAPELTGINNWLNSSPLTIQELKGKVVLIDFWTYSCINCIRTLPYTTRWYDTYKDKGLVIIGVHTPEFSFERDSKNVEEAIKQFKINYPVAQDNDYKTWQAYGNIYWPAEYLIDQNGKIVYEHFGEGNYDETENTIRTLLGIGIDRNAPTSSLGNIKSPEIYFGTNRLENLSPKQTPSLTAKNYSFPDNLALNNFALSGSWIFANDKITSAGTDAKIRLKFSAAKVYLVASSPAKNITIKITVDGQPQPDVTVNEAKLYTLFDSDNYGSHTLEAEIPGAGLEAFTFTFG